MKISLVPMAKITLLAAGALAAGCATGPKLDYTDYAGEPVKSFYMGNFDGWTAVSKDQLVVWSGINKAYLLNVTGYCPDLQFANAIAVTSTGNTVDRFEKVHRRPRPLPHQRNPSARHEADEGRSQAAARADEEARRAPAAEEAEQPEAKQPPDRPVEVASGREAAGPQGPGAFLVRR